MDTTIHLRPQDEMRAAITDVLEPHIGDRLSKKLAAGPAQYSDPLSLVTRFLLAVEEYVQETYGNHPEHMVARYAMPIRLSQGAMLRAVVVDEDWPQVAPFWAMVED